MRAASTGGGPVRLVVIWLVVLAALVMTAAGASSTSAAAGAAGASATVAAAVTATAATAAAHHTAAASPAAVSAAAAARAARGAPAAGNATAGHDDVACEPVRVSLRQPACTAGGGGGGPMSEGPGPPPSSGSTTTSASSAAKTTTTTTAQTTTATAATAGSSKRSPVAAAGPPSRCPAATCAHRRADNNYNNNNNNINNDNDNIYNKNNNNYNNDNAMKTNNNNNYNYNKNNNNNNSNHQCLEYARPELMPEMCPDDPGAYRRPGRLSRYRLRHCCHHTVESVVQQPYADKQSCDDQVRKALDMDDIAAAMSCQFNEVLARYDCQQKYSAMSCDSCKDAYALWACAAVLPHWTRTVAGQGRRYRVTACRSVCLEAEQKCPWLLPVADDANPYAGEAAFTCIDPDIGFQMSAADAKEECCYEHCADGLCTRNASACRDDDAASRRPVCVEKVPLAVEESECTDYSLTDSGAGGGPRRPSTVALPLASLLSALSLAARTAAVT